MYGSIAADDGATEPLLARPEDNPSPTKTNTRAVVDPRSQKMRRQQTKRKLKEIQKEQPVLRSIFDADQRKVKEQIKLQQQQRQRRASSRIIPTATVTAAVAATASFAHNNQKKKKKKKHSFVYCMLSPYSNKWQARIFKRFIAIVIITDLILFMISTDPNISNSSSQSSFLTEQFFHVTEGIVSFIFLVEYLARLYCITEKTKYSNLVPPWRARWAYMTTWPALLDLMATLPFFVELAIAAIISPTGSGFSLPRLTVLRCFRLFRILKTDSYIVAMDAVYRVVYYNREILTVAMLVCLALVLFTSVLLYICRPPAINNNVNFDSIGDTLYISTLMLTGQGGPDGDNLPWYTKAVILLTSVFSVAMFAIPASMLTWGFEAEAERMAKRARKLALQEKKIKSCQQEDHATAAAAVSTSTRNTTTTTTTSSDTSSSTSSSSAWTASDSDGDTTDEEYLKLIAGEDDDDDNSGDEDKEQATWMKQIRANFAIADHDMDGTLTIQEFLRMQVAARHQQQKEEEQQQQAPSQPLSSSAATAAAAGSNNDTLVTQRLEALERQSVENAQKLDQILAILENNKKSSSKRW